MNKRFETRVEIAKFDENLGLVMGYIIICKVEGEDYFDLHGDHIPEDAMLKAAKDFMENSRTAKEMHSGQGRGTIVFAWPLTTDIAKAFNIETHTTGLMIAMKPDDEMLEKFRSGELTGFSIGGFRGEDEEAD